VGNSYDVAIEEYDECGQGVKANAPRLDYESKQLNNNTITNVTVDDLIVLTKFSRIAST
jgi:hypothetical protein